MSKNLEKLYDQLFANKKEKVNIDTLLEKFLEQKYNDDNKINNSLDSDISDATEFSLLYSQKLENESEMTSKQVNDFVESLESNYFTCNLCKSL